MDCTFLGTFLACPHGWFIHMSPSQRGHTLCGKANTPHPQLLLLRVSFLGAALGSWEQPTPKVSPQAVAGGNG